MSNNLKDILSNLNKDVEQEKLIQYLNSKLDDKEQHEVEQLMNEDEFLNDAVEGLQSLDQKKDIPAHIHQLNEDLIKQLQKRKVKKEKRKIPAQTWNYLTILIVLLLIIIGFLVIWKMQG